MALRKFNIPVGGPVLRNGWARHVQGGNAPVASPAFALQQYLVLASFDPAVPYERYPLAFRLGFLIMVSVVLWVLIFSAI